MSERAFSPGDLLGHYRLIEKIGKGGQGEVWRTKDERFGRHVALKILPAQALADSGTRNRFRREAMAVGKLNHPNIATAHDFDTQPVYYLVTEYVSGSGLDQRLAAGALSEDAVIALGIQLASGLEAAHREGIIHRDLKPGNLRINDDGKLKILDFGLAEMFDPSKDIASLETITINLTLTGTLPYMAPEQFSGIADQRTDLWSAGAVLYEMATGKLPFPETQVQELRKAIQTREPLPPSKVNQAVSGGLEQVILKCLKKNPSQRYQSATELREDLERLAQGRKTREEQKRQGRRFAVAALAAVLAISAFLIADDWPKIRSKLWPTAEDTASRFTSMAILPLESANQNSPDDALVRGIADTVTARIADGTNRQKLQVIPASELIAQHVRTVDAARREFGVERVLEVSLQRSGEKVRVTCSLIDSKTHKLVKACSLTGNGADLFGLQDELAVSVVAMLPHDLRNEQAAPSEVQAAAPAGYEYYLKGRGYLLDYQKPENINAAITEFEHALMLSPNYGPAYAGLGEAYWQRYKSDHKTEWLDKASSNCDKSAQTDPRLAQAHACLANVYRSRGQYELSLQESKKAVELDSKDVLALLALADGYDKLHKDSEAESTFKRAIEISPNYWAVYNWFGNYYYRNSRYRDAEDMFRKSVELKPGNHRALYNLGGIYLMEGRYQEAIDASKHSLDLRPTLQAYDNLGTAYFYLHRYSDAVTAYQKARDLDDRNFMNWGNLGDALYWSVQRRSESADIYKRAIQLAKVQLQTNPNDPETLAFMASYYAMLGDKPAALSELQKALQLDRQNSDVMFRAAIIYNQIGDQRQTLEWLKKAAAANFSRSTIRDTPDFDALKRYPAFEEIVTGA